MAVKDEEIATDLYALCLKIMDMLHVMYDMEKDTFREKNARVKSEIEKKIVTNSANLHNLFDSFKKNPYSSYTAIASSKDLKTFLSI